MLKLFLRNIKKGFATNSSSYHSTLIMTGEEYDKWVKGEIVIKDMPYDRLCNEEYYYEEGMYYYIEDQAERILDNGQKIVAITYCETNEY